MFEIGHQQYDCETMVGDKPFDLCLVVDDDSDILLALRLLLRSLFVEVIAATSPGEGLALLGARVPDVILLDANFGRGATDAAEGLEWLGRFLARDPDAVIVMITAHGGVQIAVEAMKRGATDFVSKPWSNERLLATVRTAATLRNSRAAVVTEQRKAATIAAPGADAPLLGNSPAMLQVHSLIDRAAPTDANVLILGENGTGKELVARELHRRSLRHARAMLAVDLGAITESLIDSELFGHVKGAFTDARTDRIGRLQAADGGSLFLDEIGNMPLHLQPRLLAALESRQITPVGGNRPVAIDIRVIAATNMSADRLSDPAHFRSDLLFRLNTVEIELPPLRHRREDIGVLIDHYLTLYARKYAKPLPDIPRATLDALSNYDWPGNVRALRHAVERAVILGSGSPLTPKDFSINSIHTNASAEIRQRQAEPMASKLDPSVAADGLNLERTERRMVEQALKKHAYNISLAATELGITRASLYRRMEKHGL